MTPFSALFLALVAAVATVRAEDYARPINQDCVAFSRAADGAPPNLYPPKFYPTGDTVSTDPLYTEVSSTLGYSVRFYNTYKVITNSVADETYVLYQCGSQPPPMTSVPAGAKFFQAPLMAVSVADTVPYAFIEALGLDDRVQEAPEFVTAPCGQFLLECNRTAPGFMALDDPAALAADIGARADALLMTTPSNYSKAFAFSATQDDSPMVVRAEWIKFLALFFNKEKQASEVYDAMRADYEDARAAAQKDAGARRPTVAWAQHFSYVPEEGPPEESYQLSFAAYKGNLTEDAGGQMLDQDFALGIKGARLSPTTPATVEFTWGQPGTFASKAAANAAFLAALSQADVVIDETFDFTSTPATPFGLADVRREYGLDVPSNAQNIAPKLRWLPDARVFRLDGLMSTDGGMDWYEAAVARPGDALNDMVRVVASAYKPVERDAFTWLRRIDETPRTLSADQCERVASCVAEPAPICPFVRVCDDGSTAVLRQSTTGEGNACEYEECVPNDAATVEAPGNAAQMAAPAVIVLTILIVCVEALINWC